MLKRHIASILIGLALGAGPTEAAANTPQHIDNNWNICPAAVIPEERRQAIPMHLLRAISQAESGRWNKARRANIAWPWTVTSGGAGKFFETKAEAVAEVEFLMTKGVRNIDVGCMQINLKAHANAFETIEAAFDPATNVAYGAKYLKTMHRRTGTWIKAAGGYHSMTPHLSAKYRAKVGRIWSQLRGLPAPVIETAKTTTPKTEAAAPETPVRRYRTSDIDYARLNRLNSRFWQRRGMSAETVAADPVTRRASQRRQQMAAWRNAQARGQDLNVLAGIRQAERAKRRKRELVAFGKTDRAALFAERRRQQMNDWRARFDQTASRPSPSRDKTAQP